MSFSWKFLMFLKDVFPAPKQGLLYKKGKWHLGKNCHLPQQKGYYIKMTWNGVQLLDLSGPAKEHMIHISYIYIYQIKYAHNWTQSTHIQQTNIYIDNKTLNPDSSFRISEVKWVKWPSATHLASLEITFPSFPALKLPHPKICPSSKLFRSKTRTIGDWELGSVCHVDGHGSGSQIRVETFQKKLPTDVLRCDVQLWLSMSSRISQLSLVSI